MALFQCNFFSHALGMESSANVILPQLPPGEPKRLLPTLYLLHGLSDDHTIWLRRTNIERYASSLGLAVVMPNGHRSYYQDMAYGPSYRTYIHEELPQLCRQFFPLSDKREDNFIAGLSMGGYGSLYAALKNPQNYAAVASLSGAVDVRERTAGPQDKLGVLPEKDATGIFGQKKDLSDHPGNLRNLIKKAKADNKELPRIFIACGTEDFLYEENIAFRDFLTEENVPHHYTEGPGSHNWAYWDARIQDVLKWLDIRS